MNKFRQWNVTQLRKRKLGLCTHIESQSKYKQAYICIRIIFKESFQNRNEASNVNERCQLCRRHQEMVGTVVKQRKLLFGFNQLDICVFSEKLKNVKFPNFKTLLGNFPVNSVVKTVPFTAGSTGSIPSQVTKIPHVRR